MNNDFHFRILTEGKTYEFDLRTADTASSSIHSGFTQYSIIPQNEADAKTINMLLNRALEKNPSTIEELSHELKLLPVVVHVSAHPISKTHHIAIQTLQTKKIKKPGSWLKKEISLKRAIAEKYWKLQVEAKPDNTHEGFIGFLRGCSRYDPKVNVDDSLAKALIEALDTRNKDHFITLFETLPMGITGMVNHGEGLNVIPPSPPTNPDRGPITSKEVNQLRQYMEETGFSGVICLSDGTKTQTLTSSNIENPTIPFAMHSVGKVFTGILAIRMIQEKIIPKEALEKPIQLDSAVLKGLPEELSAHLTKSGAPTMRQIMLHQSGLGDYLDNYQYAIARAIEGGNSIPTIEKAEDFLEYADKTIIPLEEGQSHYSNIGILLVGLSIQHHYNQTHDPKKSFNEILEEFVIAPAGLSSFSSKKPDKARYNEHDPVAPHIVGGPAGGYWIAPKDLLKFGEWTAKQCEDKQFNELVEQYGGEFQPEEGEISHGGQIDSATSFLGSFLLNGITVSILSDRPFQAAVLEAAIRENILAKE